MKHNIYDLFSEYSGELPEIKEKACDAERIKQLVSQKIKQSEVLEHTRSQVNEHNSELHCEADNKKHKTHFIKLKKLYKSSNAASKNVQSEGYENEEYCYYEYKVKGADSMKQKWFKPLRAAVIALIVAGGLVGSLTLMKSMKSDKSDPDVSAAVPQTDTSSDKKGTDKDTIKVAFIRQEESAAGEFDKHIQKFKGANSQYRLEVTEYRDSDEADAFKQLTADISGGTKYDLIAAYPGQLRVLDNRHYLADLGEYIDSSTNINRSDFLPNALDAMTIGDHIPAMAFDINIETICCQTERLDSPHENWTIEEAVSFIDKLSDEEKSGLLGPATTKKEIAAFLITGAVNSSVDFRNNKFNAENGLRQALEYIYSMPDDSGVYKGETARAKQILSSPYVCIDYFYGDRTISQQDNKPVTLVGFPTESGNGYHLDNWNYMYGIMDNAENKEGAWAFIELFLSDEMQSYVDIVHGLPVMESAHKQWWDRAPEYQFSINSPLVESYDASKKYDSDVTVTITDAQKKQLDDYIHNMNIFLYEDKEVINIIKEECDYVINGERTPDQCIDILNDRIGTYLAENE